MTLRNWLGIACFLLGPCSTRCSHYVLPSPESRVYSPNQLNCLQDLQGSRRTVTCEVPEGSADFEKDFKIVGNGFLEMQQNTISNCQLMLEQTK